MTRDNGIWGSRQTRSKRVPDVHYPGRVAVHARTVDTLAVQIKAEGTRLIR